MIVNRELIQKLEALEAELKAAGIEAAELDEVVHEAAASMASDANNAGLLGQLTFLFENDFFGDAEEVKEYLCIE